MAKIGTWQYVAEKLFKAAVKRRTSQGKINVLIDAVLEGNFAADETAHFFNEAIIHKHPRDHLRNTWKYGIKPRLMKKLP